MAEIRAQVAYHFKIDPAKMVGGHVQFPETITRTVAVGEEIVTEKVSILALPSADRALLVVELEKQIREATRTAKPVGAGDQDVAAGGETEPAGDEMSAF